MMFDRRLKNIEINKLLLMHVVSFVSILNFIHTEIFQLKVFFFQKVKWERLLLFLHHSFSVPLVFLSCSLALNDSYY